MIPCRMKAIIDNGKNKGRSSIFMPIFRFFKVLKHVYPTIIKNIAVKWTMLYLSTEPYYSRIIPKIFL